MTAAQLTSLLNVATLFTIMLAMGLQVKLADVLAAARQWPLVASGLLANYVLVPLVTVLLLVFFQADVYVSAGFLILAVAPGAPAGPPLTQVARGNLALAVGQMIILAALSAVLSPVLLVVLLSYLHGGAQLQIDFLAIVRTLVVAQLLPLGLGLAAGYVWPQLSGKIARPLATLGNLLLLVLVGLILVGQFSLLANIRLRGWGGMTLLLLASLASGWICGGRHFANRTAMMFTAGIRNAAVGLVIVGANFAGTAAVTAVVAYGLASLLAGIALAVVFGKLAPQSGGAALSS